MLETDERDTAATHDQLAGVCRAHAHHQVQIDGAVRLQPLQRASQRLLDDRDDIHILEQPPEIGAVGAQRGLDDRLGVRRARVQDVVLPVCAQEGTMAIKVLVVRRGRIWRGQRREELRNEIDEHSLVAAQFGKRSSGIQSRSAAPAGRSDLTLRLRRRTQPAADLGEELPFRGRETLDAAGDDLVEDAVDLGAGARIRGRTAA